MFYFSESFAGSHLYSKSYITILYLLKLFISLISWYILLNLMLGITQPSKFILLSFFPMYLSLLFSLKDSCLMSIHNVRIYIHVYILWSVDFVVDVWYARIAYN